MRRLLPLRKLHLSGQEKKGGGEGRGKGQEKDRDKEGVISDGRVHGGR